MQVHSVARDLFFADWRSQHSRYHAEIRGLFCFSDKLVVPVPVIDGTLVICVDDAPRGIHRHCRAGLGTQLDLWLNFGLDVPVRFSEALAYGFAGGEFASASNTEL